MCCVIKVEEWGYVAVWRSGALIMCGLHNMAVIRVPQSPGSKELSVSLPCWLTEGPGFSKASTTVWSGLLHSHRLKTIKPLSPAATQHVHQAWAVHNLVPPILTHSVPTAI